MIGRDIRIGRRPHVGISLTTAQIRMRNVDDAMGVFTISVLSIPSGKILDKNCECIGGKRSANLLTITRKVALNNI